MATKVQTLKGYYKFQYDDSTCVYLLKDPKLGGEYFGDGLHSSYSTDNGKTFYNGGFFPFWKCNYFRKLKRKPR